jgi:hypothetical protein
VGGGGPFGGREGGKVRLEAAITERCLVAGEKSCVVLRVTNDSQKKVRPNLPSSIPMPKC